MSEAAPLLAGARNFRAVKPYQAANGRRLKADTLYRSGELSRLSADDLARLRELNIRLVCDLRSSTEQAEYSSRWPDGSLHRHLDLPDRDQSNASPDKIFKIIASVPGEAGALRAMDMLYRHKPRAFAGNLALLVREILAGDALPLLIHCHAGKDRTGFIVALLLAAAGVSRNDIIDDYETTSRFFPEEEETSQMIDWAKRTFGHELQHEAARPMVQARPDYIAASFAEIEAQFGGVEAYLADAVGLNAAALERYRELVTA
jgi:protein-tyrosine phosphatase